MLRFFSNFTLQVEVTTSCNLDCKICLRRNLKLPAKFLSFDHFKRILCSGIFKYVGLHGWGEPLLNPHLFEMIEYAESQRLITNLTTNGMFVHKHRQEILESGLRQLAFGVYDKELFSQALPQIEELVAEKKRRRLRRPELYFDITAYEGNVEQIPELVKLASTIGVDAVILHRLFDVYGVDEGAERLSDEDEERLFGEARQIARSLRVRLYLPPKHSYPCRIIKRHCIFVTVDGKVTPCTYLLEDYLGDALEDGVGKVIASEAYRRFVKNMKQHPICSKCRW